MKHIKVRSIFTDFFVKQGHVLVPSSSLLPEDDPSVLLTTAGMQQFKPYMAGIKDVFTHNHVTTGKPLGSKRLCSIQKSFRTTDIDSVGDATHLTFFEMLGNFSIGDYFKKEAIEFAWKLLTEGYKISPSKLRVTIFKGENDVPEDREALEYWKAVGVPEDHIYRFGRSDNFWGPSGNSGPCGPCTEIHYDFGDGPITNPADGPNGASGRFLEIWNLVFMQFFQDESGKLTPLKQRNIDTGMGIERIARVLQNKASIFDTDLFMPIISEIELLSGKNYNASDKLQKQFRIAADHLRGATFLIADGVRPSNKEEGYVLRRILRRAFNAGRKLDMHAGWPQALVKRVVSEYGTLYPTLTQSLKDIQSVVSEEEERFAVVLTSALSHFERLSRRPNKELTPGEAFQLYETYGVPYEIAREEAEAHGLIFPPYEAFEKEMEVHRNESRKTAEKRFAGTEIAPAHTASHLLNQALRVILSPDIHQKGQKIGVNEFRHDFNFDRKLTPEEIGKLENLVNEKIKEDLPVTCVETTFEEARKAAAEAQFADKYKAVDKVTMYTIGDFSKELCGGPHVRSTKQIKHFTIVKEESVSRGVRRIYGKVTPYSTA